MHAKNALVLGSILACLVASAAIAQQFSRVQVDMFRTLKEQPTDLARYDYLAKVIPFLNDDDRALALQLLASAENELGLYNEAVREFPLKSQPIPGLKLPEPGDWEAQDAAEVIAKLASNHRIVMVNEAHHDAHTRQLSIELLAKLRAEGFTYFAAEALGDNDDKLNARGYPVLSSGSEYLHEPVYGELIRQALRLGYKVIPYDSSSSDMSARESEQARNLYERVFAKDPQAKLFVHAGYAHIDKAVGRLGRLRPMGMQLAALTGLTPLSVDQTQFREQIPAEKGSYQTLVDNFKPTGPTVLTHRGSGKVWAASPDLYDATVILPPSGMGAVESGYLRPWAFVTNNNRNQNMWTRVVNAQRPEWLKLDGLRRPVTIANTFCRTSLPCVIDAQLRNESKDAVPVDRYTFTLPDTTTRLYLQPGSYRLRASDAKGEVLAEKDLEVKP